MNVFFIFSKIVSIVASFVEMGSWESWGQNQGIESSDATVRNSPHNTGVEELSEILGEVKR